ncbi:MAG: phosphotransferase [Oscillospiraceae bacterium]|jgi:thiamine kinase-like enzyme|nr:phosphotransferase [Oscillospiraceae bacterium]
MFTWQQLIESLNKYYGLKIIDVKIIDRLMFRQSFLVNTFDGNQYIVKDYAETFSLKELFQMWGYYWKLRELGISIGCPLRRLDSDEFHISLENRYCVVFEYIKGNRPSINQYKEIANCLKKYHGVATSKLLPDLISTEEKLNSAKDLFLNFNNGSYSIKQEILSCKENLYNIIDNYSNSNQTVIHGDTILENMILNDEEVCLIDFDTIRYGDSIEDVANTVLSFMYSGSKKFEVHPGRLQQIKAFINSYYENTSPTDIEKKIHYYMQVHCVIDLIRHAENIRFLIRMPSMKEYLLMLVRVICSKNLNALMQEGD